MGLNTTGRNSISNAFSPSSFWVNYANSLPCFFGLFFGEFEWLSVIPVRLQWCNYNLHMQIIGVGSDIAMYIYICKYDQTINHKINMYYMTSSSCQEYTIARFWICLIVYVQTDGQQWHSESFQLSSWLSSVRRTVDGKFKEKRSWFTFVIGVIGISWFMIFFYPHYPLANVYI